MESASDFYQIDFTTVSDWEIFIAKIEEVISKWNLPSTFTGGNEGDGISASDEEWTVKNECLTFERYKLDLRYYRRSNKDGSSGKNEIPLIENIMHSENDFKSFNTVDENVRNLIRWYGLTDFLVLVPNSVKQADTFFSSESNVRLIVSSFSAAASNVKCEIPIFVQALQSWQQYFLGFCLNGGLLTDYEMIHLKKVPAHCKHLTGLLNVFKSRLFPSFMSLDEPISVSVRFSYTVRDFSGGLECFVEPPELKFVESDPDVATLKWLPFGTTCEPIASLTLHTIWPNLSENVVADSESYSDLEPLSAPVWSLRSDPLEKPNSLLSSYIEDYVKKCCCAYSSMKDLIPEVLERNSRTDPALSDSLNKLTKSALPSISEILKDVNAAAKDNGDSSTSDDYPIPNESLMMILYYLFPDADKNSRHIYNTSIDRDNNVEQQQQQQQKWERQLHHNLQSLKSCPVDGLVWRLSLVMIHLMYTPQAIRAMVHLWHEFTQELNFRCENGIPIPGVELRLPDYRTCLLNQKLQLLNCCIEQKVKRERASPVKEVESMEEDNSDDSDEEFYDCRQTVDSKSPEDAKNVQRRHRSLWNRPVGRLRKLNNMKLINTGEFIYEPFTQQVAPKTEDQLEEDASILLQLGTDSHGSALRSKLMSASLCSDMEAFKAANPDAALEDFIRWYSPRDWIEQDELDGYGQKKGQLSARMLLPDNIWKQVWDVSTPVPAARQKRLFNDTQEAKNVLLYFESLSPAGVFQLLLPSILHIGVCTVLKQVTQFPVLALESRLQQLIKKASNITQTGQFNLSQCTDFVSDIAALEITISQYKSLKYKLFPECLNFPDEEDFLKQLIDGVDVTVPFASKGDLGNRILILFSHAKKYNKLYTYSARENDVVEQADDPHTVFPYPSQKEYILRTRVPRPSPASRLLPQKLVAAVSTDHITMAGCFSRDIIFL